MATPSAVLRGHVHIHAHTCAHMLNVPHLCSGLRVSTSVSLGLSLSGNAEHRQVLHPRPEDPGTPLGAPGTPRLRLGSLLRGFGGCWALSGSSSHILVTRNSIFSVLGLGLDSLGGRCPQWLLLRGASHVSLEEPKSPQTLAAAQKVAGAHGAGQLGLPEETQAQVRAEVTTERGQ